MPIKIKPLTKKELVGYFQVYREAFPDWIVKHDVVLVRTQGPIEQHIAFQALRSGAYRPSCSIEMIGSVGVFQLLFQFLDIKHEQVQRREHDTKWSKVLKAMDEQFVPPVRQPLKIKEVLALCEKITKRDGIKNINNSCGLAALNTYTGNIKRAVYWCIQIEKQLTALGREPADWELQYAQFARELREAIRTGQNQEFLQTKIVQQH